MSSSPKASTVSVRKSNLLKHKRRFPFHLALLCAHPQKEKYNKHPIRPGKEWTQHGWDRQSVREDFLRLSPVSTGQSLREQQNSCFHTLVGFERSILHNEANYWQVKRTFWQREPNLIAHAKLEKDKDLRKSCKRSVSITRAQKHPTAHPSRAQLYFF